MARDIKRSDRERFKYGFCLNDECEKCKSKEIQKIPMRKDFVCQNPECGKELRECAPPKKSSKIPVYIAGIVAAIVIVGGCIYAFSSGNNESSVETTIDTISQTEVLPDTTIKSDTVVVHDTIVKNNTITTSEKVSTKTVVSTTTPSNNTVTQTKPESSNGKLHLSYGTYTGSIKNGYPHGQGRLTYSTSRTINRNDMKGRTANAGDYVIGEFHNGFVVYGKHYDSAGNLVESLNFGVGSESSYDSK